MIPMAHWDAVSELIAPQDTSAPSSNAHPAERGQAEIQIRRLLEFMYTRSMYQTADMGRQGEILNEVAKLVDNGVVEDSLSETLHRLSVEALPGPTAKCWTGIYAREGKWLRSEVDNSPSPALSPRGEEVKANSGLRSPLHGEGLKEREGKPVTLPCSPIISFTSSTQRRKTGVVIRP